MICDSFYMTTLRASLSGRGQRYGGRPLQPLLTLIAAVSLVPASARAEEVASFHCSFKGALETMWKEAPVRSEYFEMMLVGRRLDVEITRKPICHGYIGCVFAKTVRLLRLCRD
jgi:hypothetical protein